jgi:hypothetical protein
MDSFWNNGKTLVFTSHFSVIGSNIPAFGLNFSGDGSNFPAFESNFSAGSGRWKRFLR